MTLLLNIKAYLFGAPKEMDAIDCYLSQPLGTCHRVEHESIKNRFHFRKLAQ